MITTDTQTGLQKLEIDWANCVQRPDPEDSEVTAKDLERVEAAVKYLDDAIFSKAYWEPIHVDDDDSIIVEVNSLGTL